MKKTQTCWIVVEDGLTGTENQCIGVAEALGADTTIKRITLRAPWSWLSPYIGLERSWSFSPALRGPWPDIVIAGGRKAVAAARYIKRKSPETFCVFLQNPRASLKVFDLIAAPAHDGLKGLNVISTPGAPNRITPEKLESAKANFPNLTHLPSPRVAVLIGGNSKTHQLSPELMAAFVEQLQNLDAGLMVTASRRTGDENIQILRDARLPGFIWDGSGTNPYLAMLGWADYILVTSDSVSMISDAGSTGKPVYILPLEGGSPKFERFYAGLREKGIIKTFEGALESWSYEPLQDAKTIATIIKERMTL